MSFKKDDIGNRLFDRFMDKSILDYTRIIRIRKAERKKQNAPIAVKRRKLNANIRFHLDLIFICC